MKKILILQLKISNKFSGKMNKDQINRNEISEGENIGEENLKNKISKNTNSEVSKISL